MFNADRIRVDGIVFFGHHGVSEAERAVGGRYQVDLLLYLDLTTAGQSDRLSDTADYAELARLVVELGTRRRFHLLEALAEALATVILDRSSVEGVAIRVTKLQPPVTELQIGSAAVEIRRWRPGRQPGAGEGSEAWW